MSARRAGGRRIGAAGRSSRHRSGAELAADSTAPGRQAGHRESGARRDVAGGTVRQRPEPPPTVSERLAVVDRLLDGSVPAAGSVWPRATAWILRIALEQTVDELWSRTEPDLARCPMRAQLLALRVIAGPPTAARIAALWTALSHAAHHHDYELAPDITELRRWREDTVRIIGELAEIRR